MTALLVPAGVIFSAIGSRGLGSWADALFVAGIVTVMAVFFLCFVGPVFAEGLADHARGIEQTLRDTFPRLRRWSWPLALLISLGLGLSHGAYETWRHGPPKKTERAAEGDSQWLQDLLNQNAKSD